MAWSKSSLPARRREKRTNMTLDTEYPSRGEAHRILW